MGQCRKLTIRFRPSATGSRARECRARESRARDSDGLAAVPCCLAAMLPCCHAAWRCAGASGRSAPLPCARRVAATLFTATGPTPPAPPSASAATTTIAHRPALLASPAASAPSTRPPPPSLARARGLIPAIVVLRFNLSPAPPTTGGQLQIQPAQEFRPHRLARPNCCLLVVAHGRRLGFAPPCYLFGTHPPYAPPHRRRTAN